MDEIKKLSDEYNRLFAGWFNHITALAIGALTVLVSLTPQNVQTPDKYFLVAAWVLLGANILFGLIGAFLPVKLASLNLLMNLYPLQKNKHDEELKAPKKWKIYRLKLIIFCQYLAIVSFCLSFISLVIYACLKTL